MQDTKKMMAQKLLQKLGSINPNDIEAITIQLVMKDGGVDMPNSENEGFEEEGMESEEASEEAQPEAEEDMKEEYSEKQFPEDKKKNREEAKREAFKKLM